MAEPVSPPTDRVVAVLELLAGNESRTVSEVARALDLNRSTATAVLTALAGAGWVERLPDRGYVLGPGLLPVAEAAFARLPVLASAGTVLAELSDATGHASALSRARGDTLTVVAVHTGRGTIPPGVTTGTRFPLRAPGGAGIIATRPAAEQDAWLAGVPEARAEALRRFLATIRTDGVGIWRLDDRGDAPLLEILREVVGALKRDPEQQALRNRVVRLLGSFSRHGYTGDELADARRLAVSYLVAPVFDVDGVARYELQLGVLRSEVDAAELAGWASQLRAAASVLNTTARSATLG